MSVCKSIKDKREDRSLSSLKLRYLLGSILVIIELMFESGVQFVLKLLLKCFPVFSSCTPVAGWSYKHFNHYVKKGMKFQTNNVYLLYAINVG